MSELVIRVEGLSKRYQIGGRQERYPTLRESLAVAFVSPFRRLASVLRGQTTYLDQATIWALRDVSFEVPSGQVVGIIGRNGAGKSTLLKVLSRITEPTNGSADIWGRVGSLLEVGTGFHPELTGRENIFLNGAILGMRRAEIEHKLDEIVAFAEVEKFLDTPVKHYSSGMYLRLAFAVAAHLEPEILLVDEVLAVGDASFQKKCLGKMDEVARQGRTVLFVSHNMEAIQRLCQRCLLIEGGRLVQDAGAGEVVAAYLHQWSRGLEPVYRCPADGSPDRDQATLLEAAILGANGSRSQSVRFGEPFSVEMLWRHFTAGPDRLYAVRLFDAQDRLIFAANTKNGVEIPGRPGANQVICRFDENVLAPGDYTISIGCYEGPKTTVHLAERCLGLTVLEVAFREEHTFNLRGRPIIAPRAHWSWEPQ